MAILNQLDGSTLWDYFELNVIYEIQTRNFTIQRLHEQNDILKKEFHEEYQRLYGNSPKVIFSQNYLCESWSFPKKWLE